MTFVDAIIIVLLIWAAVSGLRQGLIVAGLSLVGAVAGAIIALRLAPLLMDQLVDSGAKVAIGVACAVVGVGLGELGGSWLGRSLSRRVTWQPAVVVDRVLGFVGHTLAVLLVTWMIAVPLGAAPIPWLSSAVRSSMLLNKIDAAMPSQAQQISSALGAALSDSGLPTILAPLGRTPTDNVPAPDSALAGNAAVQAARGSILKVMADAPQCSRGMEGTGFVIADDRVLTNAHVVAGSATAKIQSGNGWLPAQVVLYDPETDLAVLQVPGLGLPALPFDPAPVEIGSDAIVAGYPLNGPFSVEPARIATRFQLRGPDIYGASTVQREVYTLRAVVQPGNSGGPLLNPDGTVIGVVFGTAPDVAGIGYALTGEQVRQVLEAGKTDATAEPTGACVPHG
ncbi:MarP family serine protease [Nakamurella lactea]|uniref:MarP family serine protease n=1 Tax=Nakamurella lactea TaxID=459515 RepID=UPI00040582BB|nr:MarP family serine protease [Nakamurella lactea]